MSWRSLLEFNHDYLPQDAELRASWADAICRYLSSGLSHELPTGISYKWRRHHADKCPVEESVPDLENKLENCRMLIQRMARQLNKRANKDRDADLSAKALDYLKRAGLVGSILRKESE